MKYFTTIIFGCKVVVVMPVKENEVRFVIEQNLFCHNSILYKK
jgi:hypothetical protein